MTPLRLLIVGLGQRGGQWLPACASWEDVEVVAAADPDPGTRSLARTYLPGPSWRLFPRLDFALGQVDADAAIICTPLPIHTETALACLQARLGVLVEKPFAMTMAEARQLIAEAEARSLALLVGQNYRHSQPEQALRRALQAGVIGEVGFIECVSHRYRPAAGTYQATIEFADMDMAIHHLDNFRAQLGCSAVSVQARLFNPPWSGYRHGGALHAHIVMENGVEISYSGSLVSQTDGFHERLEGSRGALVTDGKTIMVHQPRDLVGKPLPDSRGTRDRVPLHLDGLRKLMDDLIAACRGEGQPETAARDNLQTLAMALACLRSSRENRPVTIEEVMAE